MWEVHSSTAMAHLIVDILFCSLRIHHHQAWSVRGTVLGFDSKRVGIEVHFFVHNVNKNMVSVIISLLPIVNTVSATAMEPLNTELVLGWVDFGPLYPESMTMYVMLMDIQKGLVFRGLLEASCDPHTNKLSVDSQQWTQMWEFWSNRYDTSLALPDHFAVVAYQPSSTAQIQVELVLIGNKLTARELYHDMVKLDLLTGKVDIIQILTNKSVIATVFNPSTLKSDPKQTFISFCDPPVQNNNQSSTELARIDIYTWKRIVVDNSSVLSSSCGVASTNENSHGTQKVHISPTQIVAYQDVFSESLVLFQNTDNRSFGVLQLEYALCATGTWANRDSFFKCVCRPRHKPRNAFLFDSGVATTAADYVLCSNIDTCSTGNPSAANASKCAPGYKLHAGVFCKFCDKDEFCHQSRGNVCPANSDTSQTQIAVDESACMCKSGYHYLVKGGAESAQGSCKECARPFYCTDFLRECHLNHRRQHRRNCHVQSSKRSRGYQHARLQRGHSHVHWLLCCQHQSKTDEEDSWGEILSNQLLCKLVALWSTKPPRTCTDRGTWHSHTHTRRRTHADAHTQTHTRTRRHTRTHARRHTYVHTHAHTPNKLARTHPHARRHTLDTNTHAHTHVETHMARAEGSTPPRVCQSGKGGDSGGWTEKIERRGMGYSESISAHTHTT